MIQIKISSEVGKSLSISVDKKVVITVDTTDGISTFSLEPSEWNLINEFVFDQIKNKKL